MRIKILIYLDHNNNNMIKFTQALVENRSTIVIFEWGVTRVHKMFLKLLFLNQITFPIGVKTQKTLIETM